MHVMSITAPCFAIGVFEVWKAWISCVFFADSSQYAAAWVSYTRCSTAGGYSSKKGDMLSVLANGWPDDLRLLTGSRPWQLV